MSYRITARDLLSGQPVASYVTRALDERAAQQEAAWLGVQIDSIVALPPADVAPAEAIDIDLLAEWYDMRFTWKVGPITLIRLGFEHPRWGKWLYRPLLLGVFLIRTKVAPKLFAATLVGLLGLVGFDADPGAMFVLGMLALMLLPLLLIKPWVYRTLQRSQARAGLGVPQYLTVNANGLVVFDGREERRLRPPELVRIYELPHFVLLMSRNGSELAIPKPAFASASRARRFARALAFAAGVEPDLGFRSEWMGRSPHAGSQGRAFGIAMLCLVAVICLLVALGLVLPTIFRAFES